LPASLSDRRARKIGLLGGSFNPAHRGHLHISLLALKHLDLDEVWWLVSPQNPLKPVAGMAPLTERVAQAITVAQHPHIRVTDIEAALGSRYTADTLSALKKRFPATKFVWLIGADNLRQIARWEKWTRIFRLAPIAVFARPAYSLPALGSLAARRFARYRMYPNSARRLAAAPPPAWVFFATRLNPLSATAIRMRRRRSVFAPRPRR
jgi:nicotinate-nucleotide adenylyltransferase